MIDTDKVAGRISYVLTPRGILTENSSYSLVSFYLYAVWNPHNTQCCSEVGSLSLYPDGRWAVCLSTETEDKRYFKNPGDAMQWARAQLIGQPVYMTDRMPYVHDEVQFLLHQDRKWWLGFE